MPSETVPLLLPPPTTTRPAHEHPIFLRFCHSPWTFVGQKLLLLVRGIFLLYTTTVFFASLAYHLRHGHHDDDDGRGEVVGLYRGHGHGAKLFPFDAGNVSLAIQMCYYCITFLWTLQHLDSPRNRPLPMDPEARSFRERAFSFFSIPRTTGWSERKRFLTSAFYVSAVAFPFVVSFLFWFQLDGARGRAFNRHAFHDWIVYSTYAVNSLIAITEIVFLSSVRKVQPFMEHCLFLLGVAGLYLLWVWVGHAVTGDWVYGQFDPAVRGWRQITVHVVTLDALVITSFLLTLALHRARDWSAGKAECDRRGNRA